MTAVQMHKRCGARNKIMLRTNFQRHATYAYGLTRQCRSCRAAYYRRAQAEKVRESAEAGL